MSAEPRSATKGGLGHPGDAVPLTTGEPPELRRQPHEHLHEGHQLDVHLQAQVGLGNDEEGRGSEECDVGCGHRGRGS